LSCIDWGWKLSETSSSFFHRSTPPM
jgi:hypothetical protein